MTLAQMIQASQAIVLLASRAVHLRRQMAQSDSSVTVDAAQQELARIVGAIDRLSGVSSQPNLDLHLLQGEPVAHLEAALETIRSQS